MREEGPRQGIVQQALSEEALFYRKERGIAHGNRLPRGGLLERKDQEEGNVLEALPKLSQGQLLRN